MYRPNPSARLVAILLGAFLGCVAGVAAAFELIKWAFQGVGAAQGFADDPNWVPSVLIFFGAFCVPIGGLSGGFVAYRSTAPLTSVKKPGYTDDLA
jgi:hypothetical protein